MVCCPDGLFFRKMKGILFFVVESKGSTGLFDLHPKEQGKIDCGIKHFKALGTEMIVASEIGEVVNGVMGR